MGICRIATCFLFGCGILFDFTVLNIWRCTWSSSFGGTFFNFTTDLGFDNHRRVLESFARNHTIIYVCVLLFLFLILEAEGGFRLLSLFCVHSRSSASDPIPNGLLHSYLLGVRFSKLERAHACGHGLEMEWIGADAWTLQIDAFVQIIPGNS